MIKLGIQIFNPSSRWYYLSRWLLLIALVLAIYAKTFQYSFIFDDHIFIVTNPYIKNFERFNEIWKIFPRTRTVGLYSFCLNYYLNYLNPYGYHVFNFVVHLLATGLVWKTSCLLFKIKGLGYQGNNDAKPVDRLQIELPFIIALLFLVHPGQTQAITYISQRFESMAMVFYLATIYCYVKARINEQALQKFILFFLAAVFAVIGIMTKEVVATVPVMILAVEWILFQQRTRIYVILMGAGILFSLLFMKFVKSGLNIFLATIPSESHEGDILTPMNYFLTQMRVFLTFIRLLVWPVNQNLEYDYPMSTGLFHPPLTLVGMVFIGLVIYLVIRLRKQYPLIAFGLAWGLITFSINLAPRANVFFEHKLYLISYGFLLAFTLFLFVLIRHPKILAFIFVGLIAVLSVVSFYRNQVWKDEVTLFEDVIKKSPNKSRVNSNMARAYGNVGRLEDSLHYFTRAVALDPHDDISFLDRGVINYQLGHKNEALADFNQAIVVNPNYFSTYVKRAWVYKGEKNYEAALKDLDTAIRLEPNFQYAYIERGLLLLQLNRKEDALKDLNQALVIAPFDFDALQARGVLYYYMGQLERAVADFTKAIEVNPTVSKTYLNRAECLHGLHRDEEAVKDMQKARTLSP